ncbi:sugar ABC transporter ATP-binding protein [Treponema primitia]|uniref:sugar ABC transporter ATP-binding protein n=1 Tax=Treponema primitia TaxID=88058 RepID=UPI0002554E0F|nr:sugar ABC transporter ATP-binding protein [Treponema primitia]
MENLLRMEGITKSFGSVTAVKDVDLDLFPGEVIALVGENGAGKSTLMNVLGGIYTAGTYEGTISADGRELKFHSAKDSKNFGIEFVHQEISLHLDLTVAENIFLGNLENKGGFIQWGNIKESTKEYLKMVQLELEPDEMVRNLSTSHQQLLSIAKALACQPKIILFDEPTSALTENDTSNLLKIITSLKQHGIACVYISHRLEEVMQIADRIVVMRDSTIVSNKPRREYTIESLIEYMVGRKLDEMYPKQEVSIGEEVLRIEGFSVPHPFILNKNIVEDISFSVNSGETLGVYGLVGSGRSETVNAIFGALEKTAGTVHLNGKPLSVNTPSEAIRNSIGLVTEDRKASGIVETMNLRENMTLASLSMVSRFGFFNSEKEKNVSSLFFDKLKVKASGIEDNILSLSGGNQQKIVLARWLMKTVKVLILDEPTRGIDVGAKVEIYNIITELVRQGLAVIMVSSELPELLGMCDRLIVIGRGKIRGNIPRSAFTQDRVMRAATCVEEYGV